MHLRRWPELPASGEIVQLLRLLTAEERALEIAHLTATLPLAETIQPTTRHVAGTLPSGLSVSWERHTEGSSLAVFADPSISEEVFADGVKWIEEAPGMVVRATRITLVKTEADAEGQLDGFDFRKRELVSARLACGARFWSDFRIHDGGYGRVLVATNGCPADLLSRAVQQLQELGNYRNLALLALPVVREQWGNLDSIEHRLLGFAARVSDPEQRDDMLMDEVSELSLELAGLLNSISYRLDATEAYAELVSERLDTLSPQPLEGFLSPREFTQRRFQPAIRTCRAHRARLQRLNDRAADMTSLLRARIETRIEAQNAYLLESMDRSANRQVRLQQLAEGFSVFALTYYGVGLLDYVIDAVNVVSPIASPELIKGVTVPVMLLVIWVVLRSIKRRILNSV